MQTLISTSINGMQFRSECIPFENLEQTQGGYCWNVEKNHHFWDRKIVQNVCDIEDEEQNELIWKLDPNVYLSIKSDSKIAPVYNKSGANNNWINKWRWMKFNMSCSFQKGWVVWGRKRILSLRRLALTLPSNYQLLFILFRKQNI